MKCMWNKIVLNVDLFCNNTLQIKIPLLYMLLRTVRFLCHMLYTNMIWLITIWAQCTDSNTAQLKMIKIRFKWDWISLFSMTMDDISARIFLVLKDDSVSKNALCSVCYSWFIGVVSYKMFTNLTWYNTPESWTWMHVTKA